MKYFKLILGKGPNGLIYPSGMYRYESEIGAFAVDHLYYDEGDQSRLLLCIPDDKTTGVVRENVIEITEAEAKTISELHEKRTMEETDPARIKQIDLKIKQIQLKQSLGITLTAEEAKGLTVDEQNALDPTNATAGFGMSKILADRIEDLKVQ